jgi:hypothetical protein
MSGIKQIRPPSPRRAGARAKILGATLAASLLIAIFAASLASASHTHVLGQVFIEKNGVPVRGYSELTSCSGTFCTTTVTMPSRDYGRVQRFGCGSIPIPISSGFSSATHSCPGRGPWSVTLRAFLQSGCFPCVSTTHGETVDVVVDAAKP